MHKTKVPPTAGICIQGTTDHWFEVSEFWKQFDCPVVWSTWDTEPARNVLGIERKGIEVVLSTPPTYAGYLNYNLQSTSTRVGMERLRERGVVDAVKVRGDSVVYGVEHLWEQMQGCDIGFMFSYNPVTCPEVAYYLDGVYHNGLDYPNDHIVFGRVDTLEHVFGGHSEWHIPVPPEALLLKRWLDYRGLEHDFRPDYLRANGVRYWGGIAVELGVQPIWFKQGWLWWNILRNEPDKRIY